MPLLSAMHIVSAAVGALTSVIVIRHYEHHTSSTLSSSLKEGTMSEWFEGGLITFVLARNTLSVLEMSDIPLNALET